MKKIYVFIVILALLLVGSIFFFTDSEENYAPPRGICKKLIDNGDNSMKFVFLGDKNVEKYIKGFFKFEPMNSNRNKFSFYFVESNEKVRCKLYKGKAVFCYSSDTIALASLCPYDHIVVLSDEFGRAIRSSTYGGVLSLNKKHPAAVFVHEFGHLVNLADEYVPALLPRGSPNCVGSCDEFRGEIDGCYRGCSKYDYHRSVENGIMRTLSSSFFGIFDENVIKNKIKELGLSPITGNILKNKKGKIKILEVAIDEDGKGKVVGKKESFGSTADAFESEEEAIKYVEKLYKEGNDIIYIDGVTEDLRFEGGPEILERNMSRIVKVVQRGIFKFKGTDVIPFPQEGEYPARLLNSEEGGISFSYKTYTGEGFDFSKMKASLTVENRKNGNTEKIGLSFEDFDVEEIGDTTFIRFPKKIAKNYFKKDRIYTIRIWGIVNEGNGVKLGEAFVSIKAI